MAHDFARPIKCTVCKDQGYVKDESGVHVCYVCLAEGRLDVHTPDVKPSGLRV